jgi:hypothetical protein
MFKRPGRLLPQPFHGDGMHSPVDLAYTPEIIPLLAQLYLIPGEFRKVTSQNLAFLFGWLGRKNNEPRGLPLRGFANGIVNV